MQYIDERFRKALDGLRQDRRFKRAAGPWIMALPRGDLDPSSKTMETSHVDYKINAKVNQVAVMHVLSVGPGRVRMGWREHIPVVPGDLCLVNLREAGHWMSLGMSYGVETVYLFTGDVPFATMYRTDKPAEAPQHGTPEREAWNDALFWNIQDVLSDYVILGRDPEEERKMRNGPKTRLHLTDQSQTDGVRSDSARDDRFPIVYRRVLGVGPGRWMTRENDLGMVEREETKSEANPGDMMALCKTVQAAGFTFQGMPLEVIHAASTLIFEGADPTPLIDGPGSSGERLEVHESVAKPLTWDEPSEDTEEDPEPPPEAQ
jgi:hypothetical protein